MSNYPIFDMIGIEYETECLDPKNLKGLPSQFAPTHDASVESDAHQLSNGLLLSTIDNNKVMNKLRINKKLTGTELVSRPFDVESGDILMVLKSLTSFLHRKGETPKSYRAGIHYHICSPYNLQILKNIIRLGSYMEDVFFRIGCQGYTFRGMKVNESQYCRPITKYGPQVIHYGNGGAQLFTCEDLLKAKSSKEFWIRYGDTDPDNVRRYAPVRYSWLNLYSLLYHGTLEFRCFNKTLNPYYMHSQIELCRRFTQLVVTGDLEWVDDMNSVYDDRSTNDIMRTFRIFSENTEMSQQSIDTLEKIIELSPSVELKKQLVWSHLEGDDSYWRNRLYNPTIVDSNTVEIANIIDIHRLRGRRS